MENKISIIIPVYNSERFIGRCLESAMRQTYKNIEVICVDDGSTDNSSKIIKEKAECDNRIIFIEQQNQGVSIARNNAINRSTGQYIMFLDSDDYMDENMCEIMINTIKKENVDAVRSNYKRVYPNGTTFKNEKNNLPANRRIFKEEIINEILPKFIRGEIKSYLWLLIIKSEIIKDNNIMFIPNVRMMQDKLFYIRLIQRLNSIYQINDCCYNYFCNENSTIQSKNKVFLRIDAILQVFSILKNDMKENGYFTDKLFYEMQKATFFHVILQIEDALKFGYSKEKLTKKIEECEKNEDFNEMIDTINAKQKQLNFDEKIKFNCIKNNEYKRLFNYLIFRTKLKKIKNRILKKC